MYVFDVSSEHNDLLEVNNFVLFDGHGQYKGYNRYDSKGHIIYNVEFTDKRYALQFKLMFTVQVIVWDESTDQPVFTVDELRDQGYEPMNLNIPKKHSEEFQQWCESLDIVIIDEVKIFGEFEPFNILVPSGLKTLVEETW